MTPSESGRTANVKLFLWVVALIALAVLYAIGYAAPGFDVYHDDGIYLVTAKALAQGSGYKIISLPVIIEQTKYPPVFPIALAAVWKIYPKFPKNIYALKIVPFGFAVGWLWLFFVYVRERLDSPEPAVWLVLFSAASPWVLFSSVAFLSETMFAFFLTAALLCIDRMIRLDRVTLAKTTLAAAIAAAAILTRTAGLPLILAGAGVFLARKKIGAALVYAIATGVFISPWWIWSAHHKLAPGSLEAYYSGTNYAEWNLIANFSWGDKLRVIATNAANGIISPGGLMGFPFTAFGFLLCLVLAGLVLYGFVVDLRKGITALNLFALLYEAMLLLWPWPSIRFLAPVLPFLLYFAYIGVADLCARVRAIQFPANVAAWAFAVLLIPFASHALLVETQATRRNGSARFPLEEQKNWPATLSAMHWVSQNTPQYAIILGDDPTIFLLTGRRAIGLFAFDPFAFSYAPSHESSLGTQAQFIAGILQMKVDYAMYPSDATSMQSRLAREQVERAAADHPAAFTAVNDASVQNYAIYAINRAALAKDAAK